MRNFTSLLIGAMALCGASASAEAVVEWNEDGQCVFTATDFVCEGGVTYDADDCSFVFDGETEGRISLNLDGKTMDLSDVVSIEVKGSYFNSSNDKEGTFGPGAWGSDDPIVNLFIGRNVDGKLEAINVWYGSRYAINFTDYNSLANEVSAFFFTGGIRDGVGVPGIVYIDAVVLTKPVEKDPEEVDPLAITGEWWHEWSAYDETATIVASDLAYCGVRLNENLGGGSAFAGVLNGTVPGNVYADFTQYSGIYVKGTPGTPWRGLFNRQGMGDSGDFKNVVLNINDEGELFIYFSQVPELQNESYIHLNTVKINWGAPENCQITKFNYISTTGIDNVIVANPYDNKMYNLQGIEVNESYKGLVIKNGVKFFNK